MERPTRDAEATKARLLAAASAEFARHGIAGARVDRIAADAQANKAQIYHYFGSKEALFDAVFQQLGEGVIRDVPIDAEDLPSYAGLLFDLHQRAPEAMRLATWHRLERGQDGAMPAVIENTRRKVDAVAEAQRRGVVSADLPAEVLVGVIQEIAALWATQGPEYAVVTRDLSLHDRRQSVIDAVARLVRP